MVNFQLGRQTHRAIWGSRWLGALQKTRIASMSCRNCGHADEVATDTFLNSTFKVYGFQHLTNNLEEDVHLHLVHWNAFWLELKNFEALLLSRDRRKRFLNTCVIGSSQQHLGHMLNKWSQTLYEKRWKCVVAFLKHLCPLMNVFRVCFDVAKYLACDLSSSHDSRSLSPRAQVSHKQHSKGHKNF